MLRNYTRWRRTDTGRLAADILGSRIPLEVDASAGLVLLGQVPYTPDEARMLGVRLIDAAVLADGDRAIREQSDPTHAWAVRAVDRIERNEGDPR
jgi:hypothetical protein